MGWPFGRAPGRRKRLPHLYCLLLAFAAFQSWALVAVGLGGLFVAVLVDGAVGVAAQGGTAGILVVVDFAAALQGQQTPFDIVEFAGGNNVLRLRLQHALDVVLSGFDAVVGHR